MIINKTKNRRISNTHTKCNSIFSKALGLMFSTKPRSLIFNYNREIKESLHMFFVFFPIDVIFLNKNKEVVELKQNFRPFSIYFPKNKAKYIIELPNNTIKQTNTEINDLIDFR